MSDSELNETLKAIGRGQDIFRRDTPMLLETLKRVHEINREISQAIYDAQKDNEK